VEKKLGVDLTVLDFLLKFRGKITGATLQLGRQGLHIPRQKEPQAEAILLRYDPHARVEEIAGTTGFTEALFKYLGSQSLVAMDASLYEGADIVHDLNVPVPPALHERFDTIFDGGTIEHVYSPPAAFGNVKQMLRPGGLFLSVNGANDQLGHGFYQFSPELLWRVFSKETGFIVELMQIAGVNGTPAPFDTPDPAATGHRMEIGATAGAAYILVAARKAGAQTCERVPVQSDYASAWKSRAG
jgi:SAM-dependent methyltransferase